MCIMHDSQSRGGPERAPGTPWREQEAAPPTSAGQLQTLSRHAYPHNPLKNLSYRFLQSCGPPCGPRELGHSQEKPEYGGFQEGGMVGRGPGILSTLPGSESVGTSPAPYSPGYVGPDLTLPTTHLDSGTPPSPVGRCTSCQALGGGGCHFWSSAQGTANKDAIIRGGGGTSPFAQLCEQTGETIFILLCC